MVEDYSSLIAFFHSDEEIEHKHDIPHGAKKQADGTRDALKEDLVSKWDKKTSKWDEKAPEWYKKSDNPENISWISPLSNEPERYLRDMGWMPEPER